AFTGDSIITNALANPDLTPEMLHGMAEVYLQGTDPTNPLASPLYANLEEKGLPPMLIQVGAIEPFLDDSVRLAERAKTAGIEVKLEVWDDMPHVFQSFGDDLQDSKEAIEHISEFIKEILKR
ncbi:MAG: alpha/beta hydrolase, partial [Promethearchaeota archaeon]